MSADDLFTESMWKDVARDLRLVGSKWWEANRDNLVGLSRREVEDMALALKAGNRRRAKQALVQHYSPDELYAYMHNTTEHFRGIAARRFAAIQALKQVGWWAARAVGTAILGVL